MLNLNTFRYNNLSNVKPLFTGKRAIQNPNREQKINSKYVNLRPLSNDTFCFTGNRTNATTIPTADYNNERAIKELFSALMSVNNNAVCEKVNKDAEAASENLKNYLETTLKDLIADEEHPDNPIEKINIRIKTPQSIKEKAAKTLAKNIVTNPQEAFNLFAPKDIKSKVRDIIGARIVLKNPSNPKTKEIIEKFTEEVNKSDGERFLKIDKIESYAPNEALSYFKLRDLEKLLAAENSHRSKDDKIENKIPNEKDTGYIAVHIDLNLSNPDGYFSNQDDYFGEIQIIGRDVSDLKELEDFCYKLKGDNDVKAGNVAYKPFSKYFLKYLQSSPEVCDGFTEYTARAFKIQRQKEPKIHDKKTGDSVKLPTIKECNMEDKVPQELDFNTLSTLKANCDNLYKLTYNL